MSIGRVVELLVCAIVNESVFITLQCASVLINIMLSGVTKLVFGTIIINNLFLVVFIFKSWRLE